MTSINNKNFIERRRSQGLCVLCGKPSENGAYRCNACKKKRNEEEAKTRKMYQKCGICPECRIHPIMGDEKVCPECNAKFSAQVNARRSKDREHYNEQHREYAKMLYVRRKDQGICTRCGKRKALRGGRSTCGICTDKDRKKRAERSRDIGFEMRKELHMCRFCNSPAKPGYKVCEKHYQMCVDKLKHPKCIAARTEYKKIINRSINARREKKVERVCNQLD